jgi:hypothetical protein
VTFQDYYYVILSRHLYGGAQSLFGGALFTEDAVELSGVRRKHGFSRERGEQCRASGYAVKRIGIEDDRL